MTRHPLCVGADPGASGGLALVYSDGTAEAYKMPETECDVLDLARELRSRWDGAGVPTATIERVHAMPRQGVSSTFKFGVSYGGLRMALLAASFALHEVTPVAWQRAMKCLTRGDKRISKARAQQMFPGMKVTHSTADSLLLASYGAGRLA